MISNRPTHIYPMRARQDWRRNTGALPCAERDCHQWATWIAVYDPFAPGAVDPAILARPLCQRHAAALAEHYSITIPLI